jgi:hypothetical protein
MEDPSNDPRNFQLNQPPGVEPGGIPSDLDVVFGSPQFAAAGSVLPFLLTRAPSNAAAGLNALRTAARNGRVQHPASPATEMSGMVSISLFE